MALTTPSPADEPTSDPARPTLAVAYDITSSSPMELLSHLRDLCRIAWIVDTGDPALGAMRRLLARSGTVVDTARAEPAVVADRLRADGVDGSPIDGVVAFTDSQLRLAATIADACGLPGNPPAAIDALNDKYVQRRVMADAGLDVPAYRRIPADATPEQAVAAVSGLRFPVVVKPLRGDSSRDVVALADTDALIDALAAVAERSGDLIAEEYLADRAAPPAPGLGGYVSVESMVDRGVVVPVALTGKFPLAEPFRETGNFMPHPLDATEAAEVVDLSVAAAAALGIRSGALHTEIKLTPDGPRIIEVNGRIGGGAIDALHTRRFGRSLTELAARIALGLPLDAPAETPERAAGPFLYEFFVQPPTTATRLEAVAGLDAVVGVAGAESVAANRSAGDALDWRNGSQGYVLRISGTAADRDELGSVPTALTGAARIDYA